MIRSGLIIGLFMASPALAGTFTPPEGCTGYMTVQMKGCSVSNHYTCSGDAPGDKWRADFGQNGMFFQSRIDFETQWVESFDKNPDRREVLELPALDPASFSELVSTGNDTYDFRTIGDDGVRENVSGFDKLTGETVVIDGVTLKRTQFDARAEFDDGTLAWHSRGKEYIFPEKRIFLSGVGEWDGGEGFLPYDSTPVTFSFPGEPGFFSSTPLFDCDALTADATPLPPTLISAP